MTTQYGKAVFLPKNMENWIPTCNRIRMGSYPIPHKKLIQNGSKTYTIKLQEENTEKNFTTLNMARYDIKKRQQKEK